MPRHGLVSKQTELLGSLPSVLWENTASWCLQARLTPCFCPAQAHHVANVPFSLCLCLSVLFPTFHKDPQRLPFTPTAASRGTTLTKAGIQSPGSRQDTGRGGGGEQGTSLSRSHFEVQGDKMNALCQLKNLLFVSIPKGACMLARSHPAAPQLAV